MVSASGKKDESDGPIARTMTLFGCVPVMMKPPIRTLLPVSTRKRVEIFPKVLGAVGVDVAVAVGVGVTGVGLGVAAGVPVAVAVAVAVAVGVPVGLGVGGGVTVPVGVGEGVGVADET